ncbi:threonine-phosphate decarboxylase CobD [Puniceicoccus vermicola]|uniref:threonine-phosphate decarboxylase n=1 Tax=Puniceicoccus vermicola TaxID=388746 RepID=A0A7X1E581_9BACT|nr:threonine-phosphate decarboxylase [Puniceicoccus vermicola]
MKSAEPEAKMPASHAHGGKPGNLFARYGLAERDVVDLSVNLNPLGIPDSIRKAWPQLIESLTPYPSSDGEGIRRFYQERFALSPDRILPGNGSIELMYAATQTLRPRRTLILTPSFHDYEQAVRTSGGEVLPIPRNLEEPVDEFLTGECFQKALTTVDSVFLGSPNNPDGQAVPRETLLHVCRSNPDTLFFVDQAFVQFLDEERYSLLRNDSLLPNLIVFSSLTKFYALAGLRLGAVIAVPSIIQKLQRQRPPWLVNGLAERCAQILLEDRDYESRTHQWLRTACTSFDRKIARIPSVHSYPSQTNFRLLRLTSPDRYDSVLRELLQRGFHVRCCRNFEGLSEGHFRICLDTPERNQKFLHALKSSLQAAPIPS